MQYHRWVSVRDLRPEDVGQNIPIYAVWEITLQCDQACGFCGSRAAKARPDELTLDEMKSVADQLAALGTREVTLIGGEAYLRPELPELISHLDSLGLRVGIQTAGRGLTVELASRLKAAGLATLGVSVNGPAEVHDILHGRRGAYAEALAAIDAAVGAGLITSTNSQICRLNVHFIREIVRDVRAHGVKIWRPGLVVPMGRAADHPQWLLQPYQVLEIIDTVAAIQLEAVAEARQQGLPVTEAFEVQGDNTLGYFGPHEEVIRSRPGGLRQHYQGCQAGQSSIGIESDGTIKACPSLPTRPYDGGNIRDAPLANIWNDSPELRFTRDRSTDELWGFCKTCYYADDCRAGCSFNAHTTMGKRGNNPFCYHRASQLRRRGVREVLVQVERASGEPYDFGRFEIREEPWDPATAKN